ncbi:MAG: hypothetical protein A4E19_16090 [Nitrospira sp. SG-bin1]|nr:MAG: hypothetical protein A4E19_16090 [Nitrospira sp. SG-bin1]
MAMQEPDVNMPSGKLSPFTQKSLQLQECGQTLTALHRLIDELARVQDEDGIIKTLGRRLPPLIDTSIIGFARSNRNRVWTWSNPRNRKREAFVCRYLLRRLGQIPSDNSAMSSPRRSLRSRHLYLVPPLPSRQSLQEQDPTFGQEVRFALGSDDSGLLLVEPKDPNCFTQWERDVLETIGAALSLALRHADTHRCEQEIDLRDPLTQLLNARAVDDILSRELRVGVRYGVPASLLLLDLDFFKTVNDCVGHRAGDHVLKATADLIRETVRDSDVVGRSRADTFVVVLPHADRQNALALAERLRGRIEGHPFAIEAGQVRTTASIGLAAIPDATVASVAEWMLVGAAALRDAKVQGRNRVVFHTPKPPGLACAVALSCAA